MRRTATSYLDDQQIVDLRSDLAALADLVVGLDHDIKGLRWR